MQRAYDGIMDKSSLLKKHLSGVEIMQLATVNRGQPWVCTVHFVLGPDGNVYWLSLPSRRHSLDIARNPNVAAAMVVSQAPPVIGVQIDGKAAVVSGRADLDTITSWFAARHGRPLAEVQALLVGPDEHWCYRLVPRTFVLFDKQNFPKDPRQEWRAET